MYLLFPSFNFLFFLRGGGGIISQKKKKISHQRQETPTFEVNYKFKSASYFSGVEPALPAHFASQGVYIHMSDDERRQSHHG